MIKVEAKCLRKKQALLKIPDNKAGYYTWWASRSICKMIATELELSFDEIEQYIENRDGLYCIYVGIATNESIRKRLNWHVNDPHTPNRVKNRTLSTLRQSISSVYARDQYKKDKTDKFIDELYIEYFPIDQPIGSPDASKILFSIEKTFMLDHLCLLNIRDNQHKSAGSAKKALRKLRKISRSPEAEGYAFGNRQNVPVIKRDSYLSLE